MAAGSESVAVAELRHSARHQSQVRSAGGLADSGGLASRRPGGALVLPSTPARHLRPSRLHQCEWAATATLWYIELT